MNKRLLLLATVLFVAFNFSYAAEGMWLPIMLKKYNIEQMQEKGFKLSAEDIYDINKASLKDAVVGLVHVSSPFHHFCTGEVISPEGLILTNHHCGYHSIQSHSSVEHDYLTDGFWAMSKAEELPNEGMGVCFLKRMEDVTRQVLANIPDDASPEIRDSIIAAQIKTIEEKAVEGTDYLAKVKPFFNGNQYFVSVYELYKDVRLVGAPPSAIGKFGGDTDNWMWPRHTGDFSMFRIYADKNNKPAEYSIENVPYQPKKFLEIAIDGVEKGDFTMVMGFPGTTQEYLPSFAVKQKMEVVNPARIKIRTKGLDIMKADMENNKKIRIQYSAKVASMANGWKKWIGENKGLQRLDAIAKKQQLEADFTTWVNQSADRKIEYGQVLSNYEKLYTKFEPHYKAITYFYETIFGCELIDFVGDFRDLAKIDKQTSAKDYSKYVGDVKSKVAKFYKDYNPETDKKVFAAFISFYYHDIDKKLHPKMLDLIDSKFKGDVMAFADYMYKKSMLPDEEKTENFVINYSASDYKKLQKDPMVKLYNQAVEIYRSAIYPSYASLKAQIENLHRTYMKGLMEFKAGENLFPDANSTFRIAYGNIDNYQPRDAVTYYQQTFLKGIIDKDNPDIYDYRVPEKLKTLYAEKDYGKYANDDGTMPVCFTASNHTTGGNSGSPVINGSGQLIGINFDRNWEGTMSDIMYDPQMCRNIALDIRYVLFIVDKFAGATHLVNEMQLVKAKPQRELPVDKSAVLEEILE